MSPTTHTYTLTQYDCTPIHTHTHMQTYLCKYVRVCARVVRLKLTLTPRDDVALTAPATATLRALRIFKNI